MNILLVEDNEIIMKGLDYVFVKVSYKFISNTIVKELEFTEAKRR